MRPVVSSTSAMLIWMEAWSLAEMIRLLAELETKLQIDIQMVKWTWMDCFSHGRESRDPNDSCTHVPLRTDAVLQRYRTLEIGCMLVIHKTCTSVIVTTNLIAHFFPRYKLEECEISQMLTHDSTYHFLGMYISTYSPASFCMMSEKGVGLRKCLESKVEKGHFRGQNDENLGLTVIDMS